MNMILVYNQSKYSGVNMVVVSTNKDLDNNMGKVHRFWVEYLLYMVFHGMGNHGNTDKHSLVSFK